MEVVYVLLGGGIAEGYEIIVLGNQVCESLRWRCGGEGINGVALVFGMRILREISEFLLW
jgi:hypothetical protein